MKPTTNHEAALAVLRGEYGNGDERRRRLWEDGFDYAAVQSIVNALVKDGYSDTPQEQYLTVEVDLSKYSGLNLKFINGKGE